MCSTLILTWICISYYTINQYIRNNKCRVSVETEKERVKCYVKWQSYCHHFIPFKLNVHMKCIVEYLLSQGRWKLVT